MAETPRFNLNIPTDASQGASIFKPNFGQNTPSLGNWNTSGMQAPQAPASFGQMGSFGSSLGGNAVAPAMGNGGNFSMYGNGGVDQFGSLQSMGDSAGQMSTEGGASGKVGGWTSGLGTALDVGNFGMGVWNAMEQSKMNDFMKGYYGDQMALQSADFANAARGTNEAMQSREERRLSARGTGVDSPESQQQVDAYMSQHGVNETV